MFPGCGNPRTKWDPGIWPVPYDPNLFSRYLLSVSVPLEHDQTKVQCPTSLPAHMGMSLVQLQEESGSITQTEGKTACSVSK